MYSILENKRLTDSVLCTVICQTEQILNFRPITAISLLLGSPNANIPLCLVNQNTEQMNYRNAYKTQEAYSTAIWQRFVKEYLIQINDRPKWTKKQVGSIKIGDLVWLIDSRNAKGEFPLGKVLEVYGSKYDRIV